MELEFDERANIFRLLEGDELEDLKKDIAENGQQIPIIIHNDKIIDGRNRYRACVDIGIEPKFEVWSGTGSITEFIISVNEKRRHLTATDRACAAVEAEKWFAIEAKERQREAGETHGRGMEKLEENFPQAIKREDQARDKAAKLLNTNPRYVSDAKRIKKEHPKKYAEMKDCEKTLQEVKREIVKEQRKKHAEGTPEKPQTKARVIYADPPWHYNDEQSTDALGAAERHYRTMSIKELCELDVKSTCLDDSILFLWTTSPQLEDAFKVIKAWGFKYKSSFVWDKVKHNMGHYNSVRHEFLLVCTRGQCIPDNQKLFDSVQSIERSEKHSEKPEEFRNIIDTLYTYGIKRELFARSKREGWEVWGNEVE